MPPKPPKIPEMIKLETQEAKKSFDQKKIDSLTESEKQETRDKLTELRASIDHTERELKELTETEYYLLQEDLEVLDQIEAELNDLEGIPEGYIKKNDGKIIAVPKSNMEIALAKASAVLGTAAETIKGLWNGFSLEVQKAALFVAKMIGLDASITGYLENYIAVREVQNKMSKKFDDKPVKTLDSDRDTIQGLRTAHMRIINDSGGTKTIDTYTFDLFIDERIEALDKKIKADKTDLTKTDLTLNMLAGAKTPEEIEKDDADVKQLKEKGAVKKGDEYHITIDMGREGGRAIGTAIFKKSGDKWEWKVNGSSAFGAEQLATDVEGLTEAQITAREDMNSLANTLHISTTPPEDDEGGEEEADETPEKRKLRFTKSLVDAFNDAAGGDKIVTYDESDDFKRVASRLVNALKNEKFDINGVKLEIDGGDLEATDSVGAGGWDFTHISDRNILSGWEEKLLGADPTTAIADFMNLNPTALNLDSDSSSAIFSIQTALKKETGIDTLTSEIES